MKSIWQKLGSILFYPALPFIGLLINNSHRTRVLIIAESKVVATKDWLGDGKWRLPGGGLHRGEAKASGAIREVKEEVGLSLEPTRLKFLRDLTLKDKHLVTNLSLFEARLTSTVPLKRQRFEISEAKWLSPDELNEENSSPDLLIMVKSYLKDVRS